MKPIQQNFLQLAERRFESLSDVPENTGFSEETVTAILGSRKPILFVEGTDDSLDAAVYRACFPDWVVMPKGSCRDVIHAVKTFRNNAELTRVTCAGIVDADARAAEEIKSLSSLGIGVLPVSEIENIFLLPEVARVIGQHESLVDPNLTQKIESMADAIIAHIQQGNNLENAIADYCCRQVDQALKRVDLSGGQSVADIDALYKAAIGNLDILAIADQRRKEITAYIAARDIPGLLSVYDNKGLLSVISHIKPGTLAASKAWIVRVLGDKKKTDIVDVIKTKLPSISAQ